MESIFKGKEQIDRQPLLPSNEVKKGNRSGMWWLCKGETSESKVDLPKLKSDLLKSIRSASKSFGKVQKILKEDFLYPDDNYYYER